MRLNPVSFIFVPGVVLAGYLIDGLYGALMGLLVWVAVVGVATGISLLMRRNRRRKLDQSGESEPPRHSQILPRVLPHRARH